MKYLTKETAAAQIDKHLAFLARINREEEKPVTLEAALFSTEPHIGDVNPPGEVHYTGYSRVRFMVDAGASSNDKYIEFPASEQDDPVLATHAVAIDDDGRVVGVTALHQAWVGAPFRKPPSKVRPIFDNLRRLFRYPPRKG